MNEKKYIIDKLIDLAKRACSKYDDVEYKVHWSVGTGCVTVKFYSKYNSGISESVNYNTDYLERGFTTSFFVHELLMKFSDMVEQVPSTMATITSKNEVYWPMHKPFTFSRIPDIKKVIFNDPATIVLWDDGSKTVVKNSDGKFDPEKGLAMAISKKLMGNKGNYYNEFRKWLPNE